MALNAPGSLTTLLTTLLQARGRGFYARYTLWAPEVTFWTLLPVQSKRELFARTTLLI